VCCVAQGRLVVCSSHAAQLAGLLDITPHFNSIRWGRTGMRASLHPNVSTDSQSAFAVGAQRGAHTVRWRVRGI